MYFDVGASTPELARAQALSLAEGKVLTDEEATIKHKNERLMEACQGFESFFMAQMFKTMRQSQLSDDTSGLIKKSHGEKMFTEMFDSLIADEGSKTNSCGIALMLFDSLKESYASPLEAKKAYEMQMGKTGIALMAERK